MPAGRQPIFFTAQEMGGLVIFGRWECLLNQRFRPGARGMLSVAVLLAAGQIGWSGTAVPVHAPAPKAHPVWSLVAAAVHRYPAIRRLGLVSRGGLPVGRVLTVEVTSYCLRGVTKSGTEVGPGTVAVDPKVIPLGSRVYVPGWGWGRALDTGRLIVGRHIDEWSPSCRASLRWGVRREEIFVWRGVGDHDLGGGRLQGLATASAAVGARDAGATHSTG